jgi:hypothetical protein
VRVRPPPRALTSEMNGYRLVFDLAQTNYELWYLPLACLLGGGLSFLGLWAMSDLALKSNIIKSALRFRGFEPIPWGFFPMIIGVTLLATVACMIPYTEYSRNLSVLTSGKALYTEGTVYDFKPMPYSGHALESFSVNGITFSYSDFMQTAAFHHTSSHGGPMKNGLKVKIWHYNGEILKLLIKE